MHPFNQQAQTLIQILTAKKVYVQNEASGIPIFVVSSSTAQLSVSLCAEITSTSVRAHAVVSLSLLSSTLPRVLSVVLALILTTWLFVEVVSLRAQDKCGQPLR